MTGFALFCLTVAALVNAAATLTLAYVIGRLALDAWGDDDDDQT
jgi:hypothetical protein